MLLHDVGMCARWIRNRIGVSQSHCTRCCTVQAPALVTQFLWSALPDAQRYCGGVQFYYSQLTNLLVIANSSVNFVVYLTFNTRFRQVEIFGLDPTVTAAAGEH